SGLFDQTAGVLTLNLFDGTSVQIKGFPTVDKIPAGPTGPAGPDGKDGKNGTPGRKGAPGPAGCDGQQGDTGITGEKGTEGRQGQQGPIGATGPQGEAGAPGPTGPRGERGIDGPKGMRGPMGPRGRVGKPGPEKKMKIVVSTEEPEEKENGMLWVNPEAFYPCGFSEDIEISTPAIIEDTSVRTVCGQTAQDYKRGPEGVTDAQRMKVISAFRTVPDGSGRCPEVGEYEFWLNHLILETSPTGVQHTIDEVVEMIYAAKIAAGDGSTEHLAKLNYGCMKSANRIVGAGKYASASYIVGSG